MKKWIHKATEAAFAVRTMGWKPSSQLILVHDGCGWAIDVEMRNLAAVAGRLGLSVRTGGRWQRYSRRQAIFWGSQFSLQTDDWLRGEHRNATAVFHGLPGTGYPEFDAVFERISRYPDRLDRIQVTHDAMEEALRSAGVAADRIHRIAIGIDTSVFGVVAAEERQRQRAELGLESDAFVVGSFQKDGNGWEEGLEPKLIKGPDLFVAAMEKLRRAVPRLRVLLSGPARGYVKEGLKEAGVPYVHRVFENPAEVAGLYNAIDAYLVSSRQEGGPNAILESMATGVPIVSTPVGQATWLIEDGRNGFLVPPEDTEAMVERLRLIAEGNLDLETMRVFARATAEANDYRAQDPLWARFFEGFVGR